MELNLIEVWQVVVRVRAYIAQSNASGATFEQDHYRD